MFEKLGGRKMTLALLALLIGLIVVLVKGDVSTSFVSLLLGVIGTFSIGNVVTTNAALKAPATVTVDTEGPADNTIALMEAHNAHVNSELALAPVLESLATIQQAEAITLAKIDKIMRAYGIDKLPD